MIYPIATIYKENNIEITASKRKTDGFLTESPSPCSVSSCLVHVEQWNPNINDFANFDLELPQKKIISNNNFLEKDAKKLADKIFSMTNEILDYITELEMENKIKKKKLI